MKRYNGPDRLKQVLGDKKTRAVAVIGSGFTIQVTDRETTPASWTELIVHGATYAHGHDLLDDVELAQLEEDLDSSDANVLVSAAHRVQQALQQPNANTFAQWLETVFSTFEMVDRRLHNAIWSLGLPLATTNYDTLSTEGRPELPAPWSDPAQSLNALRGGTPAVLHLHGVYTHPPSVVFGQNSYGALLADKRAQFHQQILAADRTLVFIGCGPGLNDPNLSNLFSWLADMKVRHEHFRLVPDEDLDKLQPIPGVANVKFGSRDVLADFIADLATCIAPQTTSQAPKATTVPDLARSKPPIERSQALELTHQLQRLTGTLRRELEVPVDLFALAETAEWVLSLVEDKTSPLTSLTTASQTNAGHPVAVAVSELDEAMRNLASRVSEYEQLLAGGYTGSPAEQMARAKLLSLIPKIDKLIQRLLQAIADKPD